MNGWCVNLLAGLGAVVMALGTASHAQEAGPRYPAEGPAIFDCAPPAPAPTNSCLLRVPLKHQRSTLTFNPLGEAAVGFDFARPGEDDFPEGLTKSATLLLIDLTPGPENGRVPSFAEERRILSAFAAGLPEGELIAVYGFHEELVSLVPFTTDRAAVRAGLDGMTTRGTNTLIGTNMSEAIDLLSAQNKVLFRNLIVVSDGEEEGSSIPVETVAQEAIEAGVVVSAIGTYWRRIGAEEIGEGKAYLTELTRPGLGSVVHAELRRGADARAEVEAFGADLRAANSASGLIVATQAEGEADITVTLKEPVPGSPGTFADRPITVRFTPEGFVAPEDGAPAQDGEEDTAPVEEEEETPAPEQSLLFGYPAYYTGLAAAALGIILALLLLLVLRRKPSGDGAQNAEEWVDDALILDTPPAPAPAPAPAARERTHPPQAPAIAFLQVEGTGKRFPIRRERLAIGRAKGNTIVLEDTSVSRVHAEVHPNRDGGLSVTDMDSANGTFLNRERIKGSRTIKPGDQLTFGGVKTTVVLP